MKFACKNCSSCCGPVPVTKDELTRIKKFIKRSPVRFRYIRKQTKTIRDCIFLDREKNRCSIYSVRPEVCKRFGFYEGLRCPNNPDVAIKSDIWAKPNEIVGVLGFDFTWENI